MQHEEFQKMTEREQVPLLKCISSDPIWQLSVIYTGICQITSGLNFLGPDAFSIE